MEAPGHVGGDVVSGPKYQLMPILECMAACDEAQKWLEHKNYKTAAEVWAALGRNEADFKKHCPAGTIPYRGRSRRWRLWVIGEIADWLDTCADDTLVGESAFWEGEWTQKRIDKHFPVEMLEVCLIWLASQQRDVLVECPSKKENE
jgi:hypothetical protein